MKKNKHIDAILVVGLLFLLIVSMVTPIVIGYNIKTIENDKDCEEDFLYDFYRYYPSDIFDYEKRVLKDYSSEDIESKELTLHMGGSPKTSPVGPMDSPWPIYCHDTYHTGRSPYSTAGNPGIEKWRFSDDHWIEMNPVIDSDGVVYICDDWGVIKAVYPNGTMKWKFTAGGQTMGSSPAIAEDGTIYVGSWDGKLYAINSNGSIRWKFNSGAIIPTSPVIADDGTIYFGTEGNKVYAVNPNGTEKWHYETGSWITSDPAIGDDDTVYIGSMDYYLYALYPNGTLRWRFKIGDRIYGSPSIADDGNIYIGSSWDSYLYALYPNGTLKWKYAGAGTPNNPSIGSDGTIYAGYLYNLVALYPNGTLKWKFYVGNVGYIGKSAPAISADGTIYFGIHLGTPGYSNGGEIIAVNPDGTERWRKRIAHKWVESSPSIAEDGTVYIGSSDTIASGYLHAFGPIESNSPPNAPTISGTTNGEVGEEYKYTFISTDPDRNPVSFYIDWGDGTTPGWTREYASREQAKIYHTFEQRGTFTISAKAKDVMGAESDWSTLSVTMPVNLQSSQQVSKQLSNSLLSQIMQRLLNSR